MQRYLRTVHTPKFPIRHTRPLRKFSELPLSRPSSESPKPPPRARGASRLTPTTLVIGFIPLFTFALGTWQVKRLRWKLDLIDQIDARLQRAPLELPHVVDPDSLPELTYCKFSLKGEWDHAHSILVGPKTRDGVNGYHVVTPLVREDGSTVLVDRGFVSKELVSSSRKLQRLDQPQGEVEVQGMLRPRPGRNIFTPNNNPQKGEWYWLDIEGMREWAGGEERGVQNLLIEELFEGNTGEVANLISHGIPVGRSGEVEVRNMHATYALTWYSLSVATGIMFVRLMRRPHPFAWRLRVR